MWNKLSMKEKAALIKVAVSNGLTDLDLIKNKYNEYAEGGNTKSSDEKVSIVDKKGAMWLPDMVVTPKALGGPLLNQNNPIESFNGGRRLPVVRYNTGGTLNENTNVNVTEDGNKVIYDFSQNADVNNPGYLGNETYDLGVLPNIEVNASTNSARSNEAYRNYLLRHEQNEFNNYITEGTDSFARPIQDIMLSTMAAPVLNPVTSRVGSYIGTKIPTIARNVGKQLFTAGQNLYDVYSTGNSIFNAFKK